MTSLPGTIIRFFEKNIKIIFWSLLALQLVIMLIMSQQAGISADEYRHIRQAEKVYNYYKTGGENKAALENTGIDPMQYNGQSFDCLMFFLTKTFNVKNYMEMRHLFNALLGWLIILLTALIAKEFWGYKGAIYAIFIMFLFPRFLGHSLNNNKDIPFAFGFILSFYGILLFLKDLPKLKLKLKPKPLIILTLGIAAAISIRMAGILSVGFLGLYSAFYYFATKPINKPFDKSKSQLFRRLLFIVPAVAIVGYFLGILFWPFMMNDPVKHFKEVLDATAAHPISLNQLFDGKLIMSNQLPSYYSLKWISLTFPLTVITGIALSIIFCRQVKKQNTGNYFYIAFALVFIFAWTSLKQSNFYGGIRHLLFIYPLAALIAVIGFQLFSEFVSSKKKDWLKLIPAVIVILLSIHPLSHIIRNYPYIYVYFNELSGGMNNVCDKYETDYFEHSIRHATTWLMENEIPKEVQNDKKIIITTNDDKNCRYYTRDHKDEVKVTYSRYYEKYANNWDYAIFYCGYITPEQITNKQWPPAGTIHTETVDGFPIAVVIKRQSKEDLAGFNALEKNPQEAIVHFKKYLEEYPPNAQICEGMAQANLQTENYNEAASYADMAIKNNPRATNALWTKSLALMNAGQYDKVPAICDQITAMRAHFYQAYFYKGLALKMMNQPNKALKEFANALKYNPRFYEAYMQMGEIYINHKQYGPAINSIYTTVSKFQPNDLKVALQTAKCYHFLNQDKNAEHILNSIPEKFHENVDYIIAKSRVEIKKGNLPQAAQLLNSATDINNNSELYVVNGILAETNKENDKAKANFEMALSVDKNNNEAKEHLKRLTAQSNPKQTQKSVMYK